MRSSQNRSRAFASRPLEHRLRGLGQELDEVLMQQFVSPGGDFSRGLTLALVGQPAHEVPFREGLEHCNNDLGREPNVACDLPDRSRPLGIGIADQLLKYQYRGRTRHTRLTGGVLLRILDENLVNPQLAAPAAEILCREHAFQNRLIRPADHLEFHRQHERLVLPGEPGVERRSLQFIHEGLGEVVEILPPAADCPRGAHPGRPSGSARPWPAGRRRSGGRGSSRGRTRRTGCQGRPRSGHPGAGRRSPCG